MYKRYQKYKPFHKTDVILDQNIRKKADNRSTSLSRLFAKEGKAKCYSEECSPEVKKELTARNLHSIANSKSVSNIMSEFAKLSILERIKLLEPRRSDELNKRIQNKQLFDSEIKKLQDLEDSTYKVVQSHRI